MKHLILALALVVNGAQAAVLDVELNVGACINLDIISERDVSGDERQLEVGVVSKKSDKIIKSTLVTKRVDGAIHWRKYISELGNVRYRSSGPEISQSISVPENSEVRIFAREVDTGIYWIMGGNELYNLGTYAVNKLETHKPKLVGHSNITQEQCLRIVKR